MPVSTGLTMFRADGAAEHRPGVQRRLGAGAASGRSAATPAPPPPLERQDRRRRRTAAPTRPVTASSPAESSYAMIFMISFLSGQCFSEPSFSPADPVSACTVVRELTSPGRATVLFTYSA